MKAVLRWILFLPVAFICLALLQVFPLVVIAAAHSIELRFTLLTLILGIIAASILVSLVGVWFAGVFATPVLACSVIAPNKRIASVIFGTLFVPLQGLNAIGDIVRHEPWLEVAYQIGFLILVLVGTIAAYQTEDDLPRGDNPTA